MGRVPAIRRFVASLVLPVLLVTGAVPGWSLFFCRHAQEAITHACCGEASVRESDDAPSAPLAIREDVCCTKISGEFERASYVPAPASLGVPPPLLASLFDMLVPIEHAPPPVDASDSHDATGPPIRLKTQSFLN